jgi:hypothetical protein
VQELGKPFGQVVVSMVLEPQFPAELATNKPCILAVEEGIADVEVVSANILFLDPSLINAVEKCIKQNARSQAQETLRIAYDPFRLYMSPPMWDELFRFISIDTNAEPPATESNVSSMSQVERLRVMMRKYTNTFKDFGTNDELRSRLFADMESENIVLQHRKTRKPLTIKKYSELEKGMRDYTKIMTRLRRYFYPLKRAVTPSN